MFSLMYAVQIRPSLPPFVMNLFQNPFFRVIVLFLVVVRGQKDPQFSLVVAISFVMVMNIVNECVLKEKFTTSTSAQCDALQTQYNNLSECYKNVLTNLSEECVNKTGAEKEACENRIIELTGLKSKLAAKKRLVGEQLTECKKNTPEFQAHSNVTPNVNCANL